MQLPFVKINRFANSIRGELSALGAADTRPRLEELRLFQQREWDRSVVLLPSSGLDRQSLQLLKPTFYGRNSAIALAEVLDIAIGGKAKWQKEK